MIQEHCREGYFPVSSADRLEGVGFAAFPVVEVAGQVQLISAGCPLPVVPAAIHMMEAVVVVCVGELIEGLDKLKVKSYVLRMKR